MNKFTAQICDRIFKLCESNNFKDKTILITGANGLIGGFLADYFYYLNQKFDYNIKLVLTSLSQNPERLTHLLNKQNVKYISKDLSNGIKIGEKIDYCFYCAGYAQPSKFLSDKTKTFFLNVTGLQETFNNIFENNKKARCVFLSSSEIYSMNNTESSHKETDVLSLSLEHKRNSYILGKITGEMIVNDFIEKGHDVVSTRVSLCYGPGHLYDDARVMSDITRKAISDKDDIKLFDDGSALRRYLHISDFIIMLLNITLKGKEKVYNIGGVEETSIYEMATYIGKYFNKNIVRGKSQNDVSDSAPKRVWISLEKYIKEFGVCNFMSFETGITNYLEWFETKFKDKGNI
tara:strand:- start:9243 stop:10286 length:1044 start_codon:yes stop_codon:yes gene_type:complete